MSRFYFDFENGENQVVDTVGLTYGSPLIAREAAIMSLPDLARDCFVTEDLAADDVAVGDDRTVTVIVRNENGASIFAAELTLRARWIG